MTATPDLSAAPRRGQLMLTLSFRLGSRLFTAVSPLGVAGTPRRRWATGAVASLDVGLGAALYAGRAGTWPRIVLDTVDTAGWVAAHRKREGSYTAALVPSLAHTIELSYLNKLPQ